MTHHQFNQSIPVEHLNSLFTYDPMIGLLRSRSAYGRHGKFPAGTEVGWIDPGKGYRKVQIGHRAFLVHRIAWAISFGAWSQFELDHINGLRIDNRLANLREVTRQQNSWNQGLRKTSTTGLTGVVKRRGSGNWGAYIRINGRTKWLGTFSTAEAAHEAYRQAAQEAWGDYFRESAHPATCKLTEMETCR